jgi:serine/threonine protein phosphatase PrpC
VDHGQSAGVYPVVEQPAGEPTPTRSTPVGSAPPDTPDLVRPGPEQGRAEAAPAVGEPGPAWHGDFRFTPFEVGDPGRAAAAPSYPDPENWDHRDTVLDGVLLRGAEGLPPMVLRAASARGRSHRFEAKVRQDAYAFRCDGRFVVAAVADGLGSGPLSHVAANVVSQHGCHMIAKQLESTPPEGLDWGHILRVLGAKVINAGRRRLQASRPGVDESDASVARYLATTILFVVVEMRPVDRFHAVHILAYGDTSAWILRSGSRWEPQQPIKNDGVAVASSSTDALPYLSDKPLRPIRARLGPDDALLMISDGIGDPLGDGTGSVAAFLAEKWRRPPEPLEFAAHVDFARRSHDDDRTAVAVWPSS